MSPVQAQAASAVAIAQRLYSDQLKDEHVLNEATNEFCSFVAVFFFPFLPRVRTTIQPFSSSLYDSFPCGQAQETAFFFSFVLYHLVIISILFYMLAVEMSQIKGRYTFRMTRQLDGDTIKA